MYLAHKFHTHNTQKYPPPIKKNNDLCFKQEPDPYDLAIQFLW